MNFDKFTIKGQKAVQDAVALSQRAGCQAIETGHLLSAIIKDDENITNFIFRKLNIKLQTFPRTLDAICSRYTKVQGGEPYLSSALYEQKISELYQRTSSIRPYPPSLRL